jgi:hypothetical protein
MYKFNNWHTAKNDDEIQQQSLFFLWHAAENTLSLFQTIYWDLVYIYNINISIHTAFIHMTFIRTSHSNNVLTFVAHKTVTIPPEIIVTITAFAAHYTIRIS